MKTKRISAGLLSMSLVFYSAVQPVTASRETWLNSIELSENQYCTHTEVNAVEDYGLVSDYEQDYARIEFHSGWTTSENGNQEFKNYKVEMAGNSIYISIENEDTYNKVKAVINDFFEPDKNTELKINLFEFENGYSIQIVDTKFEGKTLNLSTAEEFSKTLEEYEGIKCIDYCDSWCTHQEMVIKYPGFVSGDDREGIEKLIKFARDNYKNNEFAVDMIKIDYDYCMALIPSEMKDGKAEGSMNEQYELQEKMTACALKLFRETGIPSYISYTDNFDISGSQEIINLYSAPDYNAPPAVNQPVIPPDKKIDSRILKAMEDGDEEIHAVIWFTAPDMHGSEHDELVYQKEQEYIRELGDEYNKLSEMDRVTLQLKALREANAEQIKIIFDKFTEDTGIAPERLSRSQYVSVTGGILTPEEITRAASLDYVSSIDTPPESNPPTALPTAEPTYAPPELVPTASPTSTPIDQTEQYLKGDVSGDGKVDITDLSELALAVIGDKTLTESRTKAADINGNGKAELTDLARLRQYLSKVITSL